MRHLTLLRLFAAITAGALLGTAVSVAAEAASEVLLDAPSLASDAGTVRSNAIAFYRGGLTGVGVERPTLILLAGYYDVLTCDDLGRSVREVRRRLGSRVAPMLRIWVPTEDEVPAVQEFLDEERIVDVRVSVLDVETVQVAVDQELYTPSVFVLYPDGRLEGMGYVDRVPGTRRVAFDHAGQRLGWWGEGS